MLDAGFWMLDAGFWMLDAGYRLPDAGRGSNFGEQRTVITSIQHPVSSIEHRASSIEHRASSNQQVTSIQHPVTSIQHPVTSIQHRAVFLDRDGVINGAVVREGKPYPPTRVEEFELLDGVVEACARLKAAGLLLVVATNQPDVGRGTLARETVEAMHERMCRWLPIDRVEVSYDSGGEDPPSEFRKPRPGMLYRAARELGIDLARSFMVGDRWRDIDCGHAAGCTTLLIDYGYAEPLRHLPEFRVKDLREAADQILRIL